MQSYGEYYIARHPIAPTVYTILNQSCTAIYTSNDMLSHSIGHGPSTGPPAPQSAPAPLAPPMATAKSVVSQLQHGAHDTGTGGHGAQWSRMLATPTRSTFTRQHQTANVQLGLLMANAPQGMFSLSNHRSKMAMHSSSAHGIRRRLPWQGGGVRSGITRAAPQSPTWPPAYSSATCLVARLTQRGSAPT